MQNVIPREVPFDEKSKVAAAIMLILGVPLEKGDAVVVLPGGSTKRILYSFNLWQRGYGKFFLIAGTGEEHPQEFKDFLDHFYAVNKDCHYVCYQIRAINTLDQVNWVCGFLKERPEIARVIVSTELYHTPRVYLSFVRAFIENGLDERVMLIPAPTRPFDPDHNFNFIAGEVERIRRYQEKGDIAATEELYQYLLWHWLATSAKND